MRRRWLALLLGAFVLTAVTACEGVRVKGDEPEPLPSAASMQDGVEVWDLRGKRPPAEDVGITEDENTSIYETRPSRPVGLRLTGASVELPTRYVAFSTLPNVNRELVSIDLHSDTMPLADTVTTFESALEQLGLPTKAVDAFERAASKASGTSWVRTDRVAGNYGDLELGVLARYSPNSGRGYVALGGGWLGAS